jgi:hypothetical protein
MNPLEKSGKAIELLAPELLVAIKPQHRLLHRLRGQLAGDRPPVFGTTDEPGVSQHIEVLHDRRKRNRKRRREFGDANAVMRPQLRQQFPPRRVGKRRESAVEIGFLRPDHHCR